MFLCNVLKPVFLTCIFTYCFSARTCFKLFVHLSSIVKKHIYCVQIVHLRKEGAANKLSGPRVSKMEDSIRHFLSMKQLLLTDFAAHPYLMLFLRKHAKWLRIWKSYLTLSSVVSVRWYLSCRSVCILNLQICN